MTSAVMFMLAVVAVAWGLSLAVYRWVALNNAWPMGVWQAEWPLMPRLIGLGSVGVALISAAALGGVALPLVLLLGLVGAIAWMLVLKVGAQSALLLAPAAAVLTLAGWLVGG